MKKIFILILMIFLFSRCGRKYGELSNDFKKLILQTDNRVKQTTDSLIITNFTTLIENGYLTDSHKCAVNFKIHLVSSLNDTITFYMTKGHSEKYYEFSLHGAAYRLNRMDFEEIITALNLDLDTL
jgi:hypothetical protein